MRRDIVHLTVGILLIICQYSIYPDTHVMYRICRQFRATVIAYCPLPFLVLAAKSGDIALFKKSLNDPSWTKPVSSLEYGI